eukprot:CAMPEP_0178592876 /NCGR_PEP_ID=MMETSP0697-20121206/29624_1 /TAXON_ID=265572 /ORGANISM="Extubocellulus spinifer, Strain CCMP396" /LENGTH=30 /DNA_ID= /DNA_START= /DNA_END= /DNA_ORIENTATION=
MPTSSNLAALSSSSGVFDRALGLAGFSGSS